MTTITKVFNSRDAAAATLRKMGIDKTEYNTFITRLEANKFEVAMSAAQASIETPPKKVDVDAKIEAFKNAVGATEEPTVDTVEAIVAKAKARNKDNAVRLTKEDKVEVAAKFVKPAKTVKAPKVKEVKVPKAKKVVAEKANGGISDWIRGLIEGGKTNPEILEASVKAGFDLTGKKRYFPAWYRWDMKQKAAAAK